MTHFIAIIVLIICVLIASLTNYYENPYFGRAILKRFFACLGIIMCMMTLMGH